jgi:hypothetical protein
MSNVYREQFCKQCGHPIKIFQIDICAPKIGGNEYLRVMSSCSNKICVSSSDIIVQEEQLGDIVYSGRFTTYMNNPDDIVVDSWNLYEDKHRDETFKKYGELILNTLKQKEYGI